MNIRLAKKEENSQIADVYMRAFNGADYGEDWTIDRSEEFMRFWLKIQPDLFFVAEKDGKVIGGAVGIIKPFWDGNYITETELFVDPDFQGKNIGKELLKKLVSESLHKYNIQSFDVLAYKNVEFPLKWYKRIGLEESDLVYLEGKPKDILENLE